eukprot:scaffold7241_cov356-Prasinococcus_capsulatus_cf.AAC.4
MNGRFAALNLSRLDEQKELMKYPDDELRKIQAIAAPICYCLRKEPPREDAACCVQPTIYASSTRSTVPAWWAPPRKVASSAASAAGAWLPGRTSAQRQGNKQTCAGRGGLARLLYGSAARPAAAPALGNYCRTPKASAISERALRCQRDPRSAVTQAAEGASTCLYV